MKKLIVILLVGILLTASLFAWGNSNTSKTTTTITESLKNKSIATYSTEEEVKSKPSIKLIFLSDGNVLLSKSSDNLLFKSEYFVIDGQLYITTKVAAYFFDEPVSYSEEKFILVGSFSKDEKHLLICDCTNFRDVLVKE